MDNSDPKTWHGTTILCVRKDGKVVIAGDGQVTMGNTIVKSNAKKLRRLGGGKVIAGFAGATADAFALFERLEGKLEQHPGQLTRACVELAKDWRTDRYLRRLEAMMAVADKEVSLVLSGTGDVLEPEDGIIGIGSGGPYALAAARALIDQQGSTPRRSHARRWRSPPRSASSPTTNVTHRNAYEPSAFSPREIVSELDRHIVGQNDAKRAVAIALRNRWRRQQLPRRAARGGAAQEHPDDRPDRHRQDRDRAPARQAGAGALHQGRGDQIHRGRLCRPRRRADRARPDRGALALTRERLRKEVASKAELAAEERVLDVLVGPGAGPDTRAKFRKMLRAGELDDTRDRDPGAGHGRRHADASTFPACRARRWAWSISARCFGKAFGGRTKPRKMTVAESASAC